jgi:hypothetical protein
MFGQQKASLRERLVVLERELKDCRSALDCKDIHKILADKYIARITSILAEHRELSDELTERFPRLEPKKRDTSIPDPGPE